MSEAGHQANKRLVLDYWQGLEAADPATRATAAKSAFAPDAWWHGHVPVGSLQGPGSFLAGAWEPLVHSFAGLTRETFLFFAGASNGRVDGDVSLDGHHWVTGTGVLRGTFVNDYLAIPASGGEVAIRWGEFCRITDGRIDQTYFLIDLVDLAEQAGFPLLPPSRGRPGLYPPPGAGDGFLVEATPAVESSQSLEHIRRFIFEGLNVFDQEDLASMGMADFFHPDVRWYGPGGIGACLSLQEFEDHHQQPWLVAFPDRKVQDLGALFSEGSYSGGPGWAGVIATHTGPYLDCGPTGNPISFNGLDWWKRDENQYIENWVFVDMVHLFAQFGVDLLARIEGSGAAS